MYHSEVFDKVGRIDAEVESKSDPAAKHEGSSEEECKLILIVYLLVVAVPDAKLALPHGAGGCRVAL